MFKTIIFLLSIAFIVYLLSIPYLFKKPPAEKAEKVAEQVIEQGIQKANELTAEIKSQMPQQKMPLEQQVRLAAGILIVIGLLLGIFVSEWFMLIPLFIGMGLISAGLTGYCGLAVLLSGMPWNN